VIFSNFGEMTRNSSVNVRLMRLGPKEIRRRAERGSQHLVGTTSFAKLEKKEVF
jgi:hypothetical protein